MRQSLFYFSGAGKFCLVRGLRQFTCGVKSDAKTLNFSSDVMYALPIVVVCVVVLSPRSKDGQLT